MKYRSKHVAEYVCLRAIVWLIKTMPYRLALFIGWKIAWISFYVFGFRRREAVKRVKEVFGNRFSDSEAQGIAWRSWRNFLFCVVDLIRLTTVTPEWVRKHGTGHEQIAATLLDHCKTGIGAILACPHMGAWETDGAALQALGVPLFFITGRQKNPLVDAYLNRLRGATGIPTIQRGTAMLKAVLRRLRKGEFLAFLPDVRMPTEGVRVQFLGKEANVVGGMGLFAHQAEVPVFPIIPARRGWTHHVLRLGSPIWPDGTMDKKEDWQRITQEVFNYIEAAIREQPDQWFWFNKRWILDPLD